MYGIYNIEMGDLYGKSVFTTKEIAEKYRENMKYASHYFIDTVLIIEDESLLHINLYFEG